MTYRPEDIARVCYEANRAMQYILGESHAAPPWDAADEHTRLGYLAGIVLAMDGATAAQQHAAWVKYKKDAGWKYGPKVDEVAKTHPNLRAYHLLPPRQHHKDRLFQAIVKTLVSAETGTSVATL